MPESGELNQTQLEQAIKSESPQQAESLQALEQEKIIGDEQPTQNFTPLKTPVLYGEGRPDPQRQTKDFVQKHGSLTRRREKRHTGRGLHPQHEEERAEKVQTVQAKDRLHQFEEQEALREGMVAYEEGDDYLKRDFNTSEEFSISEIEDEFKDFFASLDPNPREPELVDRFLDTARSLDRLRLLTQMNTADAVTAVLAEKGPGSEYLLRKLSRYRDMMEGKATKQWDYDKGQYVDVEVPMSSDYFTPENLALGLLRHTLYAEMIGTPELAAVKIATKRLNEGASTTDSRTSRSRYGSSYDSKPLRSVVELFGYYSGVHRGSPGLYENLCELYERNHRQVIESQTGESTDDQLEHRAVLTTATMLKDAYSHGGVLNTSASPYNPSFEESVAVGRLGSDQLKRQLKGMRSKIQQTDLHNIGRFIGKAGDDKYGREARKIHWELKHLPSDHTQREEWALRRNIHDLSRSETQWRRKQEAIMMRLERKKEDIAALELPEEEGALQLQSITTRYEDELRKVDDAYHAESQRLRSRTPEQLIEEMQAREEALKEKHDRHKSLAQKALDLHFAFRGKKDDDGYWEQSNLEGVIDWINYAPFGTINRAHKALQQGVSPETIISMAVTEIVLGKEGITRQNLDRMRKIVEQAQQQGSNEYWRLTNLSKVGSMLQQNGVEAPLDVIEDIASKRYQGIHKALKEFSLDEVRDSLDKGINLYSLAAVRRTMESHGHELTTTAVQNLARHFEHDRDEHITEWLGKSLDKFGLDDTRTLITSGTALWSAVRVSDIAKRHGHNLSIPEIVDISGKMQHDQNVDDFAEALNHLPLPQVKQLLQQGVAYRSFAEIRDVLKEHQLQLGFNETVRLASSTQGYELSEALGKFSLQEVETLVSHGASLRSATSIKEKLDTKSIQSTFQEVSLLAKQDAYYVGQAVDRFGYDTTLYLANRDINLYDALNAVRNNTLQGLGITETPELIAAISRHKNGSELLIKVVKAGFKPEEIVQYPFLLSPLFSEMAN